MEAWDAERADRALAELRAHDCTAALVFGDREAALIEAAASRRGLDVPGRLAVVSYDDELAEIAEVPLTAMSPAKFHLGAAAAEVMLPPLGHGRSSAGPPAQPGPHLVVRDSCGASAFARPPGG